MKLRKVLLAAASLVLLAAASGLAGPARDLHNAVFGSGTAAAILNEDETKDHITAQELKQRIDKGEKVVVIDARHSISGQMIKVAVHVPGDKLEDWAKNVAKTTMIVTYCTCPHDEAADAEMKKLREWGFKQAYSLSGGLAAATAAGVDVIPAPEP